MHRRMLCLLLVMMAIMTPAATGEAPDMPMDGAEYRFLDIPFGTPGEEVAQRVEAAIGEAPEREDIDGSEAHFLVFRDAGEDALFPVPATVRMLIGPEGLMNVIVRFDSGLAQTEPSEGDLPYEILLQQMVNRYADVCGWVRKTYGVPDYGLLRVSDATFRTAATFDYPVTDDGVDAAVLARAFIEKNVAEARVYTGNVNLVLLMEGKGSRPMFVMDILSGDDVRINDRDGFGGQFGPYPM